MITTKYFTILSRVRSLCDGIRPFQQHHLTSRHITTSPHYTCAPSATSTKFEPPYVNDTEPKVGLHSCINIQMKGYDHTVLQSYQGWVAKTVGNMGITVSDRFASPCSNLEITLLKKKSDIVEDKFHLNLYERTVQVIDLPSPLVAVVCEVLQAGLPEGVQLCLDHHQPHHKEIRYVPDLELKQLRKELDDLGGPIVAPTRRR